MSACPLQIGEACGARVEARWFTGNSAFEAWCSRTSGPCPYPEPAKRDGPCAAFDEVLAEAEAGG